LRQNRVTSIFALASRVFGIDNVTFVNTRTTVYTRLKITVTSAPTLFAPDTGQDDLQIIRGFFCERQRYLRLLGNTRRGSVGFSQKRRPLYKWGDQNDHAQEKRIQDEQFHKSSWDGVNLCDWSDCILCDERARHHAPFFAFLAGWLEQKRFRHQAARGGFG
jgi:hypothetical protein